MSLPFSRRRFLAGGTAVFAASTLSACSTTASPEPVNAPFPAPPAPFAGARQRPSDADYAAMYAAVEDGGYQLPAIPFAQVDRQFLRQVVDDPTGEAPGTVVVDTKSMLLHWVLKDGKAVRYGVGLGRAGHAWKGRAIVQWKRKWPKWTPPDAMIRRDPKLEKWRQGMPPGLHNPMGSRALYIFKDGVDTLYRIHGSPEWRSIGKSVSAGCVRMFHQDVMDLYERVPSKTPLLVI